MKKLLFGTAAIGILVFMVGCANGPLRQWMNGAPCSTCNPPIGQPASNNLIGGCNSGACSTGTCGSGACSTGTTGSGFLGSMFRPNGNTAAVPPASLPATSFSQAPPAASPNSEFYGNTVDAGRLELPPNPYN